MLYKFRKENLQFKFLIIFFKLLNSRTVIDQVFKVAGYTYGPLLGLFAFGLISKRNTFDNIIPAVAVICILIFRKGKWKSTKV